MQTQRKNGYFYVTMDQGIHKGIATVVPQSLKNLSFITKKSIKPTDAPDPRHCAQVHHGVSRTDEDIILEVTALSSCH